MNDDAYLWDMVKQRCIPLGQPAPTDQIVSRLEPVEPRRRLDLHNLTVAQAYEATRSFIAVSKAIGLTDVEIVTGRSGQIRAEFEGWALFTDEVRGIKPLTGDGAFRIKI